MNSSRGDRHAYDANRPDYSADFGRLRRAGAWSSPHARGPGWSGRTRRFGNSIASIKRGREMTGRAVWRTLHRWLGLGVGVLVAATALSGTFLAFAPEIDRTVNPGLWLVKPSTRTASLEQVRQAAEHTGGPSLRMLLFPDHENSAILALQVGRDPSDRWEVFVDPHSARVLGKRRYGSTWLGNVKIFHSELLAGKRGRWIVAAGGIASLLLGGSGFALWWTNRPSKFARPRSLLDWHRQVGLLGLLPSTILALSGSYLILRPYALPVLTRLTGAMPLEQVAQSPGSRSSNPPSLDDVRERAIAAYPNATVTRIYLPEGEKGSFAVRMRLPEDQNPNGNTAVRIDRYSGEMIQRHSSRETTATQKFFWYNRLSLAYRRRSGPGGQGGGGGFWVGSCFSPG